MERGDREKAEECFLLRQAVDANFTHACESHWKLLSDEQPCLQNQTKTFPHIPNTITVRRETSLTFETVCISSGLQTQATSAYFSVS